MLLDSPLRSQRCIFAFRQTYNQQKKVLGPDLSRTWFEDRAELSPVLTKSLAVTEHLEHVTGHQKSSISSAQSYR